jgi:putative ABC transport system permease protein
MIRPRWYKVLADIWGNRVRSLLVIASIAVGLFAVGLIRSMQVYLSEDMPTSYASANPANIQIRVTAYPNDFVDTIARIPGIADAEGAALIDLRLKTAPNTYIPITINALPDIEKMLINRVTLVEGTFPPRDQELVLDVNKLGDTGARLGDLVEIKLPSGTVRSMRLVGVIRDQTVGSYTGGGGFFLASAQGYVTYDTLEWLEQPSRLNYLYATVSEGSYDPVHIQQMTEEVLQKFADNSYIILNSMGRTTGAHPNVTYLDAIGNVLVFLGLFVVFLSGFLITNTLSALLNQQMQQVGIMKTVGATRRQVSGIYMVLILVYSALALALAMPTSSQAAYALERWLSKAINFIPGDYRVAESAIWMQVGIAVLIPQLAGYLPILQGTRISIQEAISGSGQGQGSGEGVLFRWLTHLRALSRPMRISLRNTFRRRVRLVLTLLTLILGGAIFIGTFNVRASLDRYVDRLGKYFLADVNLVLSRTYRMSLVEQDLKGLEGVTTVEGWAAVRAVILLEDDKPGESIQLQGVPADSRLIEPIVLQGRWVQNGDRNSIVLSELFTEKFPGLKVGDTIRLKVNEDKTDWKVAGFFQFAGSSAGLIAYSNYDYLAELTHITGRASVYRVVGTGALTLEGQQELARRIEARLETLGYKVSDVRAGLTLKSNTARGLDILTTFLLIMALLMAVVGSIGLTGTMSLNVLERTREIGIMRAIGAHNGIIMRLVMVEGLIIGSISWLLGCLASYPIGKLLSDAISESIFGVPIEFSMTWTGVLIWLGVVLVLSVVASLLPARTAARLTIREVLAYE